MKKKTIELLFILLFLVLCLIPGVGMLIFGESEAAANEILTSKPSLTKRDGSLNAEVLSDFSDYIADRFAFRQELVTVWSWINAAVFHSSVEDQVVLGSDGWLYYSETLDDYIGIGMDDAELEYAARNLYLMQEYAENQGARFVFTAAPNKNSLYPENMPSGYPNGHDASNGAKLPFYLDKYGVNYSDLFSVFQGEDILYFRTDSHWNGQGAALAADSILSGLGIDSEYASDSFSSSVCHTGDLYEMLYPAGTRTEPDPQYAAGFTYRCENDPNGGNAITIQTKCEDGDGVLLCWRDSFGISLYPYLAQQFGEALFSRASSYDLTQIGALGADTVIIELVERNLDQLITKAPVFASPVRHISPEAESGQSLAVSVASPKEVEAGLLQVTGEIAKSAFDPGSGIYVQLNGITYEACVLRGSDSDFVAFSAWLPSEPVNSLKILVYSGELLTLYDTEIQ